MKFSDWLRERDCLLHILVTRHFGQWGFESQLIKKSAELEAKDNFLFLITDAVTQSEEEIKQFPHKKISGFGADKFASIANLAEKVSDKSLCYLDESNAHVSVDTPAELSYGDDVDYAGLIKNDETE